MARTWHCHLIHAKPSTKVPAELRPKYPPHVINSAVFQREVSDSAVGFGDIEATQSKLELSAEGFAIEVDLFSECARRGLRAEIPVQYSAREDEPKLVLLRRC